MPWLALFTALSFLVASSAGADPRDLERFTSFELGDTGPLFEGDTGSASFSGGASLRVGILSLYHSGVRSWQVPANGQTTISFDPPGEVVELMALDQSGNNATMTARTPDGLLIGTIDLDGSFPSPMNDFSSPYQFADSIDGIGAIVVTNGSGDAWLDSFGFTPLPEPDTTASAVASLLVLCGLSWARRARTASSLSR